MMAMEFKSGQLILIQLARQYSLFYCEEFNMMLAGYDEELNYRLSASEVDFPFPDN